MNIRAERPIRLELDQRTAYQFAIISKQLNACLAEMHVSRFAISTNEWKVMSIVERFAPVSATEVGTRTSLEPAKVTRALDSLTARGLVIRRRDKEDGRRVSLSLSAKGKRTHGEIETLRFAIEHEFLEGLNGSELDMLYAILDRLEPVAARIYRQRARWPDLLVRHSGARGSRRADESPGTTGTHDRPAARSRKASNSV